MKREELENNWDTLRRAAKYSLGVEGNGLSDYGIFDGDILCCDYGMGKASLVVATWENLAHVCVEGFDGELFVGVGKKAPPDAVRMGRVLYLERRMIHKRYLTEK